SDYFTEMGWTPPWSDKEEPEDIIEMARFLRNFNTWDDSWNEDAKLPPPLSKEIVANLPEIKIKSNEKQCSICLKQFETGKKAKLMPCEHIFHPECILPWLEETSICPLCGYDLSAPAYIHKRNYEINKKEEKEREDLEFVSSFYNCLLTMLYITCKRFITLYEHLIQKMTFNKKT
ncbi:hypothetical protein ALC56_08163, partial [Trachymyrmex septentrionalis]